MLSKASKAKRLLLDKWSNMKTGLGGSRDQNSSSTVSWARTSRTRAETLQAADDMAAKIAQTPAFDATREGITWNIERDDLDDDSLNEIIKTLDEEFTRLKIWDQLYWAMVQGNVYGGAVIFISVDDGMEYEDPLDLNKVRKINALHVFDRWDFNINSGDLIADIDDPNYGTPEFYDYNASGSPVTGESSVRIHHSRILRFDGAKLPTNLYKNNGYWHDSIYGKLYIPIRNYSTTHDNAATLTAQLNTPVYSLDGLNEAIAQDESELVVAKLALVNDMRSSMRAIVLDKEDVFSQNQIQLTGAKDLVDLTTRRLVAATPIPHTRLLGEAAGASLGEAGRSELTDYYDYIKSQQLLTLQAPITRLTEIMFHQIELDITEPEAWSFTFDPLYQQDQKALIETRKIQADIDNIYMTQGVYDSFEVAENRFGSGEFSYETSLDMEEKEAAKEAEVDPGPPAASTMQTEEVVEPEEGGND